MPADAGAGAVPPLRRHARGAVTTALAMLALFGNLLAGALSYVVVVGDLDAVVDTCEPIAVAVLYDNDAHATNVMAVACIGWGTR